MRTDDDLLVAAGHCVDPGRWLGILDELMLRVGARFRRVEPRRRARAFVLGLLAGLPRKNCWTLAVQAGEASPDEMQHLLERAVCAAAGLTWERPSINVRWRPALAVAIVTHSVARESVS